MPCSSECNAPRKIRRAMTRCQALVVVQYTASEEAAVAYINVLDWLHACASQGADCAPAFHGCDFLPSYVLCILASAVACGDWRVVRAHESVRARFEFQTWQPFAELRSFNVGNRTLQRIRINGNHLVTDHDIPRALDASVMHQDKRVNVRDRQSTRLNSS